VMTAADWAVQPVFSLDMTPRFGLCFRAMGRCTIGLYSCVLLAMVLSVIVLLLLLPQVDLLDTAFHGNTSPLAVHAQATSGRALMIGSASLTDGPAKRGELRREPWSSATYLQGILLDLSHSLRC